MEDLSDQEEEEEEKRIVEKPGNAPDPRVDMGDVLFRLIQLFDNDFRRLDDPIFHKNQY